MARYIDADALRKETKKKIKEANSYRMAVVDTEFLDLIDDAETAIEWFSVDDCFPQPFVSVLGYMSYAGDFPSVRECYFTGENDFFFPALREYHTVSHWMPMPEPPKGADDAEV